MIIPWGTDAPIYHRPIVTIGMIVVNVLALVLFPSGQYEDWTLVLGEGIHPAQWLTNNFMHVGLLHLVGNMIFLWTFGLIVEGKLGWWRFLLLYLGLATGESAAVQLLVHPATPIHMLGASGIVFGLLAICLVWAPMNEVVCIVWFRFTPSVFDVSILWFVAGYVALDFISSSLKGAVMASVLDQSTVATLAVVFDHVTNAIVGFIVGTVLLKLEWVDCENWDIFAVIQGRKGQTKAQAQRAQTRQPMVSAEYRRKREAKSKRKKKKPPAVTSIEDAPAAALRTMRLHLEFDEIEAALSVYQKSSRSFSGWQPDESSWVDLIQALLERETWGEAASVMRDYVQRTAQPSPRVRLKLAQVLLQRLARPLQALTVLSQIPDGALPPPLEPIRQKLIQQAEHMREEGDLELQDELW